METIMTKTSKQLNKIAVGLAILLTAFDGEGRAQTEPPVVVQQCAVNCATALYTAISTCAAAGSCQGAVNTLKSCLQETTCTLTSPVTFPTTILLSCVSGTDSCWTTFSTACGTGSPSCIGAAAGALTTCVTGLNKNSNCIPPANNP